jgi:hypothetical protein
LTDDEESESEASHKTEPPVTDITRIIPNTEETESEKANVSANTAATELAKPNVTQDLNPFFTLASNTSWTQVASKRRASPKPAPSQLQQSSADSATQSIDLLDSSSSVEPTGLPPEASKAGTNQTILDLRNELNQLRATISDIQIWKDQTAHVLATASDNATRACNTLDRTDIVELSDNIHTLKTVSVQKETYDRNRVRTDNEITDIRAAQEDNDLNRRLSVLENQEWITHKDYRQSENAIHADIKVLNSKLDQRTAQPDYHKAIQAIDTTSMKKSQTRSMPYTNRLKRTCSRRLKKLW